MSFTAPVTLLVDWVTGFDLFCLRWCRFDYRYPIALLLLTSGS